MLQSKTKKEKQQKNGDCVTPVRCKKEKKWVQKKEKSRVQFIRSQK